MGGAKLSPEQTRAQDAHFVSQCSLLGLQQSLPLKWPIPAEIPASPKKRYRSAYVYPWLPALADPQQVQAWKELSDFDLLLRLVDFSGLRPVLAYLLGWKSGRGWEPFDPVSFFLLVVWQIANRWSRSQMLKNLADERYADYAAYFGFHQGNYPTEGGVRYFLTTLGRNSEAPGETVTVPLTISDSTGLSGFDVELSFPSDERVLSLQSVAAGALTAGFKQEVNQGDGYVRVSMSSTEALEDAGGVGGDLVALTFAVTGNALIGTSLPVRVSAVELKGEYGDSLDWSFTIDKTDGVITVNEERILGVTPLEQQVGADAGTTTFEVANAGSGTTMPWAAEVTSGSAWLSIQSGTGGVDTGTIQVGFTANSSTEPRSGAVQVMAEGAEGSPAILAVIQDGAPPGEGQCQCLGGTLDIPTRAGRLRDSIGDVVLLGLVAAVLMYGILRRRSSSFP